MKTSINIRRFACLSVSAALLMCCSISRANITGTTLSAYDDGVMYCYFSPVTQIGSQSFQQDVYGGQNVATTGNMFGDILTDTEEDPSLTLNHSIDNDTLYAWTDYHLKITLNKTFTISGVNVANVGWTSVTTAPAPDGFGNYIGYIDYYSGNPVPIGQILSFGYTMTFLGSVSFSEDLTPTFSVPEPASATLVLMGMGALVCTWRLKQGKQT